MFNLIEKLTSPPKDLSDLEYWEVLKLINPEQAKEIQSFAESILDGSSKLDAYLLAVGGIIRDPDYKKPHGDIDLAVVVDQGDPDKVNDYIKYMVQQFFPNRKIEIGADLERPSLLVQKPIDNNSFVPLQIYLADIDSTDRYDYYNQRRRKPVSVLGRF